MGSYEASRSCYSASHSSRNETQHLRVVVTEKATHPKESEEIFCCPAAGPWCHDRQGHRGAEKI